ncbi:class I SAM-dependent methyltransferase [Methylobacterium sp. WL122]|nr:class I SAM-dependent methyltransferase [Methylobacterium sp. WL122]
MVIFFIETGAWMTGIDPGAAAIAAARDRAPNCTFEAGSAESLPFADGSFDGAVILNALHHVPDPRAALGEAARVAVPGGRIVRRRIERVLDPANGGPVALDPGVQVGERRVDRVLRVDHEAAADDLGPFERPKVGREPAARHPRVGIGGEQDPVGASVGFEPGGTGVQRHPPGGPDMGLGTRQMRLDDTDRERGCDVGGLHRAHGGDGAVGAVVGHDQDAKAHVGRDAVLGGERAQEARQAHLLVAGGHADDRLFGRAHGQA